MHSFFKLIITKLHLVPPINTSWSKFIALHLPPPCPPFGVFSPAISKLYICVYKYIQYMAANKCSPYFKKWYISPEKCIHFNFFRMENHGEKKIQKTTYFLKDNFIHKPVYCKLPKLDLRFCSLTPTGKRQLQKEGRFFSIQSHLYSR